MKVLWHNRWADVPDYAPVEGGHLVEVEASVPIVPVRLPGGRVIESPRRKVVTFLRTDGPMATARKARSKQTEDAYLGDYWTTLVLGTVAELGRVVCLAPRVPRSASRIIVNRSLCVPVDDDYGREELERGAAHLAGRARDLQGMGTQTYLYSGVEPPKRLIRTVSDAVDARYAGGGGQVLQAAIEPPDSDPGSTLLVRRKDRTSKGLPLAVLGAGDYVRIEVGPALRRAGLDRMVICDREPQVAALAADALNFGTATTDPLEAIAGLPGPGVVVVATNHDSHAELASVALEAGHCVFLEKPSVVTPADQRRLLAAVDAHPGKLELGFNRRYNPLVRRAARMLGRSKGPVTISAMIREVSIEPHHWYLWPNQGTRVAGNLCHWIDLAVLLVGARGRPTAVSVSGRVDRSAAGTDAERAFTIEFDDGSVASLVATSRGDGIRGVQERIDVRSRDLSLHIDDLWSLQALRGGTRRRYRTLWRDKGHQSMYREALGRFVRGEPARYPRRDLELVGATQLVATELVTSGETRAEIDVR